MSRSPLTTVASESAAIDWPALRRRLEQARIKLEAGVIASPERRRQILRERARLAAVPLAAVEHEPTITVVEFSLAYERYAVEVRHVREIAPMRQVTPLPSAPEFVTGIVNLRGRILSVVDLKRFFNLPEQGLTDLNKVIVLQDGRMEFGILADGVAGVHLLQASHLQPLPPTLTGVRAEFSRAVTNGPVVVLDAARILSDRRLILAEVASVF